jgi:hypothetical protein
MATTYWVDLTSHRAVIVLRVNGFDVAASWDGLPRVTALDFSHAVVRGRNNVQILAEPTGTEPEGSVDLHAIPEGHAKGGLVVWFEWVLGENELLPAGPELQRVYDADLELRDAPASWCWERARPWDRPTQEGELRAVVAAHHAAFAARNLRPLHTAARLAIEERAVAQARPVDDVRAAWLAGLSEAFVDDTFRPDPLREDELSFEPAFGGRVVHVRAAAGRHPLRGRRGVDLERAVVLPLSFAHLDGQWQVVR